MEKDYPVISMYCLRVRESPGDLFPPRCSLKPGHDGLCRSEAYGGWGLGRVEVIEW